MMYLGTCIYELYICMYTYMTCFKGVLSPSFLFLSVSLCLCVFFSWTLSLYIYIYIHAHIYI